MIYIMRFVYALFLSIDLIASALTGGAPWQTISARLAKGEGKATQVLRRFVDFCAKHVFGEANHCQLALDAYDARMKAAATYGGK